MMVNCAGCQTYVCYEGKDCVRGQDFTPYQGPSKTEYSKTENKRMLEASTRVEGEHYMQYTRLDEMIAFSERMEYQRIGIAHCVGLTNEAHQLKKILDKKFEVHAICCKFTGTDKKEFNLTQIHPNRYEAICNPIGQALVLNDLKTDLNIIVGLCVGHDMLFTKYSEAPVTTFIVKDRVTGHNPAVTIYSNYYKKRFEK
jgi:uncharacterized metal-binding protein